MSPAAAGAILKKKGGERISFLMPRLGKEKRIFEGQVFYFSFFVGGGGKRLRPPRKFPFLPQGRIFFWQVNSSVFLWRTDLTQRLNSEARKRNSTTHSRTLKPFPTIFFEREFNMQSVQNLEKNTPMMTQYFFLQV